MTEQELIDKMTLILNAEVQPERVDFLVSKLFDEVDTFVESERVLSWDDGHAEGVEEVEADRPDEDKVSEMVDKAYDQGYEGGKAEGYDEGYAEGKDDGYSNGYTTGYDDGFDDGEAE